MTTQAQADKFSLDLLKAVEEKLFRQVASVHGYCTKEEIDLRNILRKVHGKQWDAVNRKWTPYSDIDA